MATTSVNNGTAASLSGNQTQSQQDNATARGAFGWEKITQTLFVPVIVRDQCRYASIRIVESELIGKYQLLPSEVFGCINIKSFYVSEPEAALLTTINARHCDFKYGYQPFGTLSDMIVSAKDVKELARFLAHAEKLFISRNHIPTQSDEIGLIRLLRPSKNITNDHYEKLIEWERTASEIMKIDFIQYVTIPYITKKLNGNNEKFLPKCLVEKFVHDTNSVAQMLPTTWDIAYLKMMLIYAQHGETIKEKLSVRDCLLHLSDLTDSVKNEPLLYEIYSPSSSIKRTF